MNYIKQKIVATVIFYNPDDDTYDNIKSYVDEVDLLIIVDNSTEHNHTLLDKIKHDFNNILYINNNANLGIATALNIACEKAIELNYRWILTMDQDSKFINFKSYIQCLSKFYDRNDISIIGAGDVSLPNFIKDLSKYLSQEKLQTIAEQYLEELAYKLEGCEESNNEKFIITSGNFLNLSLFHKVGRFNDELFIDEVDHEYCAKSLQLHYKIIKLKNIKFIHSLGYQANGVSQHNHIRVYYIIRNRLYMMSKYHKEFPEYSILEILSSTRKRISHIMRKEEDKKKKLYSAFLAIIDFIFNRYGKRF
jgi:rhamnosyltransferase